MKVWAGLCGGGWGEGERRDRLPPQTVDKPLLETSVNSETTKIIVEEVEGHLTKT